MVEIGKYGSSFFLDGKIKIVMFHMRWLFPLKT